MQGASGSLTKSESALQDMALSSRDWMILELLIKAPFSRFISLLAFVLYLLPPFFLCFCLPTQSQTGRLARQHVRVTTLHKRRRESSGNSMEDSVVAKFPKLNYSITARLRGCHGHGDHGISPG